MSAQALNFSRRIVATGRRPCASTRFPSTSPSIPRHTRSISYRIHRVNYSPGHLKIVSPLAAIATEEVADTVASNDVGSVKFSLPHHVEFGQTVCLIGSVEPLGAWDPTHCVPLDWEEGDVWSVKVEEVPCGTVEYKYVVLNEDGSVDEWIPGDNLVANVTAGDTLEITDEWADGFADEEIDAEEEEEEEEGAFDEEDIPETGAESETEVIAEISTQDETSEVPEDDVATGAEVIEDDEGKIEIAEPEEVSSDDTTEPAS